MTKPEETADGSAGAEPEVDVREFAIAVSRLINDWHRRPHEWLPLCACGETWPCKARNAYLAGAKAMLAALDQLNRLRNMGGTGRWITDAEAEQALAMLLARSRGRAVFGPAEVANAPTGGMFTYQVSPLTGVLVVKFEPDAGHVR